MKYASATAFRRALETRLLVLSRDGGESLVRLRKSVAFDRLLARLFAVAPDRWVLKGGLALDYRLGAKARTTMDIDLAGPGGEDAATADLLATGELDLGDRFSFTIERTAKLDQLVEGSAVRYHVRADLGGRLFEEFLLDVGFDFPKPGRPWTWNLGRGNGKCRMQRLLGPSGTKSLDPSTVTGHNAVATGVRCGRELRLAVPILASLLQGQSYDGKGKVHA